jgi:hypothetical protein
LEISSASLGLIFWAISGTIFLKDVWTDVLVDVLGDYLTTFLLKIIISLEQMATQLL